MKTRKNRSDHEAEEGTKTTSAAVILSPCPTFPDGKVTAKTLKSCVLNFNVSLSSLGIRKDIITISCGDYVPSLGKCQEFKINLTFSSRNLALCWFPALNKENVHFYQVWIWGGLGSVLHIDCGLKLPDCRSYSPSVPECRAHLKRELKTIKWYSTHGPPRMCSVLSPAWKRVS